MIKSMEFTKHISVSQGKYWNGEYFSCYKTYSISFMKNSRNLLLIHERRKESEESCRIATPVSYSLPIT